jgi:uncharacterized repeat protein (TIGR03847 family)
MSTDLGLVQVLGADAVGQPGQRRFRLFTLSNLGSAVMWLEKEQLAGLAEAVDRSLALISEGSVLRVEARPGGLPEVEGMPDNFPLYPNYEVQIGQMRLNFDEQEMTFTLNIIPIEAILESGEEPQIAMVYDEAITFAFTLPQAQALSHNIQGVMAAGRPVCPLCHTPLDDGPHACVKQNGHREIIQIENSDEDE